MLILDRNMLSNKYGFKIYFELYNKALEADLKASSNGHFTSNQLRSVGQTSSSGFGIKDQRQDVLNKCFFLNFF